MRSSRMLIPTIKETPKDATLPSHRYLIRGGFIQQVGSGIYNFLPLGKIVLEKIRTIIKEELDRAGCQEVQLGFVTPAELWENSGRLEKYGKELLRFKDRKEGDFVLGPTHEEMVVELVKPFLRSYKDLPKNLYQINLKFRDEMRPRFGLMRGREFLMKDGYSFHETREDMVREFELMEATYRTIFTRLGLEHRVVEADSGAIGGEGSKEFMVLADSGEDTIVVCSECEYAANIEAAKRQPATCDAEPPQAEFAKFHTPGVSTIESLSSFFKIDPFYTIKAIAKKAIYDDRTEPVLFFVRGSDELQETKAENAVHANELQDLSVEELDSLGIAAGFIGPFDVQSVSRFVFDQELKGAQNLVCGANEQDYHLVGVSLHEYSESLEFADLAAVQEGDRCSCCGAPLLYRKGIEVGHIFQLETKYSEPLQAHFLDRNGKSQPYIMGTYGIGVSRLLAAVVEQHHDDKGCIWTKSTAPFALVIIVSNIKDEAQKEFAESLYGMLQERGVSVLLDDRTDRFGAKMADFELVGYPYAVVVGKGLVNGEVELVAREGLAKTPVPKENIVDAVMEKL